MTNAILTIIKCTYTQGNFTQEASLTKEYIFSGSISNYRFDNCDNVLLISSDEFKDTNFELVEPEFSISSSNSCVIIQVIVKDCKFVEEK